MNGVAKRFWTEILDVTTPLSGDARQRRAKRQRLVRKVSGRQVRAA